MINLKPDKCIFSSEIINTGALSMIFIFVFSMAVSISMKKWVEKRSLLKNYHGKIAKHLFKNFCYQNNLVLG